MIRRSSRSFSSFRTDTSRIPTTSPSNPGAPGHAPSASCRTLPGLRIHCCENFAHRAAQALQRDFCGPSQMQKVAQEDWVTGKRAGDGAELGTAVLVDER